MRLSERAPPESSGHIDYPLRRAPGGLVIWDRSLDIVATLELRWQWKDEHRFARIQELGWVTPEEAAAGSSSHLVTS